MQNVNIKNWERQEMRTQFWWGILLGNVRLEGRGDGKVMLNEYGSLDRRQMKLAQDRVDWHDLLQWILLVSVT
jgi:hypothetical protein